MEIPLAKIKSVQGLLASGQLRFAEKKHLEALAEYAKALRIDPASAEVLIACGEVLSDYGLHTAALHAYKRAAELEPQDPNVSASVVISLLDQRRVECAEHWCMEQVVPVVQRRVGDLQRALVHASQHGSQVQLPPQLLDKEIWPMTVLGSRFMQVHYSTLILHSSQPGASLQVGKSGASAAVKCCDMVYELDASVGFPTLRTATELSETSALAMSMAGDVLAQSGRQNWLTGTFAADTASVVPSIFNRA
jgi:tetratricopeptide (TPR) repeat protein